MKTYVSATIVILLIVLAIFFSLKSTPLPTEVGTPTGVEAEAKKEVEEDKATLATPVTATRYENAKYGFSFEKPEGYTVGLIRDDFGETLLVQNSKTNSGFQIYVTPVDTGTVVTKAQIQSDLPGTTVVNSKTIKLDGKADGLIFESNSAALGGKSFEIWFIYKNFLYQVSSYKDFAIELQKIINTWSFSK